MPDQTINVNTTVGDVPVSTTSTLPDSSFDTLSVDHTINIGAQSSPDINVAIAVDTSGSAGGNSGSDVDGDGTNDTFLEAQVYAAKQVFQTYIDNGYDPSTVTVTLVEYSNNSSLVGVYNLDQLLEFEQDIDALTTGGSTNFAAPLQEINDSWTAQGVTDQSSNSIIFMSDGVQNSGGNFTDEAQALEDDFGALISGVGVGANSGLNAGRNGGLNDLDNTGGSIGSGDGAIQVVDTSQLTAAISAPPPILDVDSVTVVITYPDPANPSQTITISETISVDDPRLVPTPSGYVLNDYVVDYEPNPARGDDIQVEITTTFNNGTDILSTGVVTIPQLVCFVAGTRIMTSKGEKDAADLRIGDLILTRDNGMQPIRWIGRQSFGSALLAEQPRARPVRIKPNTFGRGMPRRALRVSQQHRMLIQSRAVEALIGKSEALVAAKKLTGLKGVEIDNSCKPLEYIHFLFDRHELVIADGAWTESLFIGPQVWTHLDGETKEEFRLLMGITDAPGSPKQPAASAIPTPREQKDIISAMLNDA
ncbi:MAG: Hint domain-containing protein [Sedimentitalea sp.]|uniref:Hint domain-containing protein n=1 Tax=Sedimentitalea sp. TaxID=2048915 RepID=UPI003263F0AB